MKEWTRRRELKIKITFRTNQINQQNILFWRTKCNWKWVKPQIGHLDVQIILKVEGCVFPSERKKKKENMIKGKVEERCWVRCKWPKWPNLSDLFPLEYSIHSFKWFEMMDVASAANSSGCKPVFHGSFYLTQWM